MYLKNSITISIEMVQWLPLPVKIIVILCETIDTYCTWWVECIFRYMFIDCSSTSLQKAFKYTHNFYYALLWITDCCNNVYLLHL